MRGLGSYNSSNTCCMSAPVVAAARFIQLAPPNYGSRGPAHECYLPLQQYSSPFRHDLQLQMFAFDPHKFAEGSVQTSPSEGQGRSDEG